MDNAALYQPSLLPDLLIEGLNRYSDEPCLFLGDRVATYKDVREDTSRMVQALQSKGLGVGARIAVLSTNRPEVLSNSAAMMVAGSRGTSMHPLGSLDDHAYVLETADVEAIVYDPATFGSHVAQLKERVPHLKHLLAFGPCEVGEDYLTLAQTFDAHPLVAPNVDPEDIAAIGFTGGTTGKPKGVMMPYRAAAYMTQIQMAEWEFPDQLRVLIATPLSHAAAAFFVPVLQKGGAFYVMPQGFSPESFFDMVETHKITATMLVPVMIYSLLDSPKAASSNMSSMETIYYGASPMNPTRLAEGIQKWGHIFHQFFGQSECPMVITNMCKTDHDLSKPERLAACGKPTPWMHVALMDEDMNPVPQGDAGEICVRGPMVMKGYIDMPEQTAEAFAGGWLHTGDVGKLDEDGFLYIVDRTKDMIVSGGFNVYPREVEDVLGSHEAVSQVVVIGVPDEQWGEAVKAVVVLKPGFKAGEHLAADMKDLVKKAKGSVQAPKSVDFVASIPLTPVGKPNKKALRAQYWEGKERSVG